VALAVTGSIAAYKAVAIASALTQQAATVDVVMTPEATRLIQPLSFQAITHRPVSVDMFDLLAETEIGHVSIGRAADLFIVAPATAHSIAKLALGLADDMVTTTALATQAPGILAPAMETNMWRHPATQEHVRTLRGRGWTVVEPETGHLASGAVGEGRLASPERIVDVARYVLSRGGDLAGTRVAVTAGGTREPIDPVRYISNRSSGKMGHALAEAARDRGANVTFVTTVDLPHLEGARVVPVERAADMRDVVMAAWPEIDVLVMAAAVADYEPVEPAPAKIKKAQGVRVLELRPTPDILAEVSALREAFSPHPSPKFGGGARGGGRSRTIVVGFAAETEDLVSNARSKLASKRLDLLVANDVSVEGSGFGSDYNIVTILRPDGTQADLPRLPKIEVAHRIWDEVAALKMARG
jgi:phosphopantothenoylcysteine decarboxylase/phosphopantothenate--cysteine ligase